MTIYPHRIAKAETYFALDKVILPQPKSLRRAYIKLLYWNVNA
jgi:hypothetical protein